MVVVVVVVVELAGSCGGACRTIGRKGGGNDRGSKESRRPRVVVLTVGMGVCCIGESRWYGRRVKGRGVAASLVESTGC